MKYLIVISMLVLAGCNGSDKPEATATSKPGVHYVMNDGLQYGYEPELSTNDANEGQKSSVLVMFQYAGKQGNRYQLVSTDSGFFQVLECENPCKWVKVDSYYDQELTKTERIKADEGTIIGGAFADAIAGNLKITENIWTYSAAEKLQQLGKILAEEHDRASGKTVDPDPNVAEETKPATDDATIAPTSEPSAEDEAKSDAAIYSE